MNRHCVVVKSVCRLPCRKCPSSVCIVNQHGSLHSLSQAILIRKESNGALRGQIPLAMSRHVPFIYLTLTKEVLLPYTSNELADDLGFFLSL